MNQLPLWPEKDKADRDPLGLWDNRSESPGRAEGVPRKKRKKVFWSKEEYYKSPEWEKVRLFALHRASHRCQRCGAGGVLQVHHLTYDRLYDERPEDLEVLCKKKCHDKADRERAEENHYESARETYMAKKYGEDFEPDEYADAEFDEWYERKQLEDW